MNLEIYQLTLSLCLVMIIIEMITGTFLFLGAACGLGVLVPIHLATGDVYWARDLTVFALVCSASFAVFRRLFRKPSDTVTKIEDINKY
ncbi:MAG: hypothetical protein FJ184_14480 [Gammaproteobacteria bacterium]|nr:hypothetical protein [Gammaproteobacteria bacterium]